MKNISFILILLTLCFNLFAQKHLPGAVPAYLMCGTKGLFNTTILVNQNILDAGGEQIYEWSFGHSYGFMLGYCFANSNAEIETEYQFNTFTQNFSGAKSGETYNSKIVLNTADIPVLFKVTTVYEGYFEIGPQFFFVRSAKYSSDKLLITSPNGTVTKNFSSKINVSGVFGMGTNFNLATNLLFLRIGVRFQFGITDLKGVDALGQDLTNKVLYPKYRQTCFGSAGLLVGLIYYIKM